MFSGDIERDQWHEMSKIIFRIFPFSHFLCALVPNCNWFSAKVTKQGKLSERVTSGKILF